MICNIIRSWCWNGMEMARYCCVKDSGGQPAPGGCYVSDTGHPC